jgi:hypothetical protein
MNETENLNVEEKIEKRILTKEEKEELVRRRRNKKILERSGNLETLLISTTTTTPKKNEEKIIHVQTPLVPKTPIMDSPCNLPVLNISKDKIKFPNFENDDNIFKHLNEDNKTNTLLEKKNNGSENNKNNESGNNNNVGENNLNIEEKENNKNLKENDITITEENKNKNKILIEENKNNNTSIKESKVNENKNKILVEEENKIEENYKNIIKEEENKIINKENNKEDPNNYYRRLKIISIILLSLYLYFFNQYNTHNNISPYLLFFTIELLISIPLFINWNKNLNLNLENGFSWVEFLIYFIQVIISLKQLLMDFSLFFITLIILFSK